MREDGKFDLGISELAAHLDDDKSRELSTALAFFKEGDTNDLYEGVGYIWRARSVEDALDMLSHDVASLVKSPSTEHTLRNISKLAYSEFGKLKSRGVRFHGEFIVHDVNGAPRLVSAVPKVSEVVAHPSLYLKTENEWAQYAQEFIKLHRGLLEYFDEAESTGRPILYDCSKLDQYLYGIDETDQKMTFVLVDSDLVYGGEPENYQKFLYDGLDAVTVVISSLQGNSACRPTSEIARGLKELLTDYTERRREHLWQDEE